MRKVLFTLMLASILGSGFSGAAFAEQISGTQSQVELGVMYKESTPLFRFKLNTAGFNIGDVRSERLPVELDLLVDVSKDIFDAPFENHAIIVNKLRVAIVREFFSKGISLDCADINVLSQKNIMGEGVNIRGLDFMELMVKHASDGKPVRLRVSGSFALGVSQIQHFENLLQQNIDAHVATKEASVEASPEVEGLITDLEDVDFHDDRQKHERQFVGGNLRASANAGIQVFDMVTLGALFNYESFKTTVMMDRDYLEDGGSLHSKLRQASVGCYVSFAPMKRGPRFSASVTQVRNSLSTAYQDVGTGIGLSEKYNVYQAMVSCPIPRLRSGR